MQKCSQCGSEITEGAARCPRCGQGPETDSKSGTQAGSAVGSPEKKKAKATVVTVVFLLVLLVVVGVCASGIVGGFFSPLGRPLVKRSLGDVGTIAGACEGYAADTGGYPIQNKLGPVSGVRNDLAPKHIKALPERDPWNAEYLYLSQGSIDVGAESGKKLLVAERFLVICTGSDGKLDAETRELLKPGSDGKPAIWDMKPRGTSCFESDIIWVDDRFVQQPQGMLKRCGPQG